MLIGQRKEINTLAGLAEYFRTGEGHENIAVEDIIALNTLESVRPWSIRYVLAPIPDGRAPSRIPRFKPDCWGLALCSDKNARNFLSLSYGVSPILPEHAAGMEHDAVLRFISDEGLCQKGAKVVSSGMASSEQPEVIDSLKVTTLKGDH